MHNTITQKLAAPLSAALLLAMLANCGGNSSPSSSNSSSSVADSSDSNSGGGAGDGSGGDSNPDGMGNGDGGGDNGGDGGDNNPPPQSAACFEPTEAKMPAPPADGQSRTGLSCAIHIPVPNNPEIPGQPTGVVAFQVLEPTTFTGGETYPLVLEGHGFSGSRQRAKNDTGTAGLVVPNGPLLDAGYGVISIDQAGHGETAGLIRLMDPDQEGRMLVAVLDWADANLPWLAQGPDEDAGEDNMLLGAIGPSYGGGYQLLLHTVDPKKRMDVMVPQITWNDLSYSIFPGTVPKALWGSALFALGNSAGNEEERANFDPFVQRALLEAIQNGDVSDEALDYFRYHGLGYFCDAGATNLLTASNGDDGTATTAGTPYNVDFDPIAPTKINAFFFQGMRDPLFNFNEAWDSYNCLRRLGGDVRLLTYQNGHNTIPVAPDRYVDPQNSLVSTCGTYEATETAVAVFNKYLKGEDVDLDSMLPDADTVCLSLHGTDAVNVERIKLPVGLVGTTEFDLPATNVITGVSPITVAEVAYDFETHGDVLAGIPYIDINIEVVLPAQTSTLCAQGDASALFGDNTDEVCDSVGADDKIVTFIGIAVDATADDAPPTFGSGWVLEDNQVYPVRGSGTHRVNLVGVGARLNAGAKIGLAYFGIHEQFVAEGGLNAGSPTVLPVSITGKVYMPLLKNSDYDTAPQP